jgi:hypothetical protein
MNKLLKAFNLLKKDKCAFISILLTKINCLLPDKFYLKLLFRLKMGKKLNLDQPKSYSEKLQWLKLYDRNPLYTSLVDKSLVKEYVSKIIGCNHVIPTLGVWNKFEEIDFSQLPNQFVLKCTHDSGGLVICKDKSKLNIECAKKTIKKALKSKYYRSYREWPYKNVVPRIIAETYMEDESGELKDYKFFCFDGKVKALFIASDRQKKDEDTKFDFFDRDFNHLPFTNGHPNARVQPRKPQMYEEMLGLAETLSKGFPHVRVDLYEVGKQIYFGEMTFFHWSGFVPFNPEEWDYKFGEWLQLPSKHL